MSERFTMTWEEIERRMQKWKRRINSAPSHGAAHELIQQSGDDFERLKAMLPFHARYLGVVKTTPAPTHREYVDAAIKVVRMVNPVTEKMVFGSQVATILADEVELLRGIMDRMDFRPIESLKDDETCIITIKAGILRAILNAKK